MLLNGWFPCLVQVYTSHSLHPSLQAMVKDGSYWDFWDFWDSLAISTIDWLSAAYIIALIIGVVTSNCIFGQFVASKPEGRKTVLGKKPESRS